MASQNGLVWHADRGSEVRVGHKSSRTILSKSSFVVKIIFETKRQTSLGTPVMLVCSMFESMLSLEREQEEQTLMNCSN